MGYTNKTLNIITTPKRVNLTPNINITTNTINNTNVDKYAKSKEVELLAGKLVGLLNSPGSFHYYCKLGWKLPENIIWNNYEKATSAKNADPKRLFTWLCNKDLSNV